MHAEARCLRCLCFASCIANWPSENLAWHGKGALRHVCSHFLHIRSGGQTFCAWSQQKPHKTAKKANADLRAGVDRDTLNAEHNARVMQEQRETTAAASKLKRERRSAEDAAARDALKRRRTSAKGKRLTASGGALAPPESHATEGACEETHAAASSS